MPQPIHHALTGILLAAGRGTRFDPAGAQSKLLQALPGGDAVAVAAARNLLRALPKVVAVVRPGAAELAAKLQALGCEVIECPQAERGMGASLAFALAHTRHSPGWVIALADMPYVRPQTIDALAAAIEHGADIAAPVYRSRRCNPVAFGRQHLDSLLRLDGDQGARALLRQHPPLEIEVEDEGIHLDIDTPADLAQPRG